VKTLFLSLLVISAPVLLPAAEPASPAGKWDVQSSIAGNDSRQACTFVLKEEVLPGQCTSDRGTVEIKGTVTGAKLSWSYKSEHEGQPLTVEYQGELDSSDTIKGSVNVPEFSVSGDFTATRSK
jgi:hypothetical protein